MTKKLSYLYSVEWNISCDYKIAFHNLSIWAVFFPGLRAAISILSVNCYSVFNEWHVAGGWGSTEPQFPLWTMIPSYIPHTPETAKSGVACKTTRRLLTNFVVVALV